MLTADRNYSGLLFLWTLLVPYAIACLSTNIEKSESMSKHQTLLNFFGPKRSKGDEQESSTDSKSTQVSLQQQSIQSYFLTPSTTVTDAAVSSPSLRRATPPSPPPPFTPKTPPTPDTIYTGTPLSVATVARKGTPPTPAEIGLRKAAGETTFGTPNSVNINSSAADKFGTPRSASPQFEQENASLLDPAPEVTRTHDSCQSKPFEAAATVSVSTEKPSRGRRQQQPSHVVTGGTSAKDDNRHQLSARKRPKNSKQMKQLYLDFGQENFAKRSICKTCGMLYVHGLSEDSQQHSRVCASHIKGVAFQMANARVVATHPPDGTVVEIRPTDSYALRQKLIKVKNIVDEELGFSPCDDPVPRTAYLYILDKRVVGMVTAEIILEAYLLDTTNLERSRQSYKAMVGIHQLWVHSKYRKQNIATRLIDAVRSKLVFGQLISPDLVAFSSPTEAGANFARRYVESFGKKGDAKTRILVYDCQ